MTRKFALQYELKSPQNVPLQVLSEGRVTITAETAHDQPRELDLLVVNFEGTGTGIVHTIASTANRFTRNMMPYLGLPSLGPGNLDVLRAFRKHGWEFSIIRLDTPYVRDYLCERS